MMRQFAEQRKLGQGLAKIGGATLAFSLILEVRRWNLPDFGSEKMAATWLMNALIVSPFLLSPIGIEGQHGFLSAAKPGDGPVTVTMDFIIIRPNDVESESHYH
jgi:hypothetical protein